MYICSESIIKYGHSSGCMDEVTQAPSGPATWFMPGAGVDSNSGSFITSETSGVKLRHRKAMTVKNLADTSSTVVILTQ